MKKLIISLSAVLTTAIAANAQELKTEFVESEISKLRTRETGINSSSENKNYSYQKSQAVANLHEEQYSDRSIDSSTYSGEEIFVAVEQQAEFPDGNAALMKWISNNLRYPEAAKQNDIQGRVIVKFVVEKDGSIGAATIAKGVDSDIDREALRIVKKMPRWKPARTNGQAVRSYFTIPVTFRLPNR